MNTSNQVKVKLATEISFFIAKIYLKADRAFCEVSHKFNKLKMLINSHRQSLFADWKWAFNALGTKRSLGKLFCFVLFFKGRFLIYFLLEF